MFKKLRTLTLKSPKNFLVDSHSITLYNGKNLLTVENPKLKTLFYTENSNLEKNFRQDFNKNNHGKVTAFDAYTVYSLNDLLIFNRRGSNEFFKKFNNKILNYEFIKFKQQNFLVLSFPENLEIFEVTKNTKNSFEFGSFKSLKLKIDGFSALNFYNDKFIYTIKNKLFLYNFIKDKIIFEDFVDGNINFIANYCKDIIGISISKYDENFVETNNFRHSFLLYNFKKGKKGFEKIFSKKIEKLIFSKTEKVLAIKTDKFQLLDLESQNIFHIFECCTHLEFNNDFLICTFENNYETSLKVYKYGEKKIFLYSQRFFPKKVNSLCSVDGLNFVAVNDKQIFNLFVFKDEQNFKYKSLKENLNENFLFEDLKLKNGKILLKEKNSQTKISKINRLDFENKRLERIFSINNEILECMGISQCGNLCLLGFESRIVAVDFNEIVLFEIEKKFFFENKNKKIFSLNFCVLNEILLICTKNEIFSVKIRKNEKPQIVKTKKFLKNIESSEIVSEFVFLKQAESLVILNIKNLDKVFTINQTEKYCVSEDFRFIYCHFGKFLRVYKLESNELVSELEIGKTNSVQISKDNNLLLTTSEIDGEVEIFYNSQQIENINNKTQKLTKEIKENKLTFKNVEENLKKTLSFMMFYENIV